MVSEHRGFPSIGGGGCAKNPVLVLVRVLEGLMLQPYSPKLCSTTHDKRVCSASY